MTPIVLLLPDWESWKWIITIFAFLLVLSSTCAVRPNLEKCPLTEIGWKNRSQAFKCIHGDVYHCIQDENLKLMEICMVAYRIKPFYEDGCPCAAFDRDGNSVLGGSFHTCSGIGCPQKNDSDYWTNELYKYPKCLRHYEKGEAIHSTKSVLDVTDTTSECDAEERVSVLTAVVVGLTASIIVTVVFVVRWYKNNSQDKRNNSSRMPGKESDVGHHLI